MPSAIAMPKLGMTMQEGTVVAWHVVVGGPVTKGDLLLSIESEKAQIDIEAPTDGVLRHVYVQPGVTVPCGTVLGALTRSADEAFDAEAFGRAANPAEPERTPPPREHTGAAAVPAAPGSPGARATTTPITPAARRRAANLGVDPAKVPGSGPGGRVTREDVDAYAAVLAARVTVEPGVALEVPTQGNGTPVLLLPGFGTDVSAFARQQPALIDRYRVRGINPRGVGFSDAPETDCYDVATAARDVAAIAGDGPVHIIGASLGAAVAIDVALEHPACVRSLTLVTPFTTAGPRLLCVLEAWCRIAAEASAGALARFLLPWMFSSAFLADETRRERAGRALAQTAARVPSSCLARHAAGLRRWSGARDGRLAAIAAPTLVIAASGDLLTTAGEEIADQIPGASFTVIADAAHAVGIEAPDQVNTAIIGHLATAEG